MTDPLATPLHHDLRTGLFRPGSPAGPSRVGAELEVIPVWADSGDRVPALGHQRSSHALLRALAERLGWEERLSAKGTPVFTTADGSRITYEPGGQLEISGAPHTSVSLVLRGMERLQGEIEREAGDRGMGLLTVGIDPENAIEAVPLMFDGERYSRMTAYFDAIGPAGARMMRQTATLHVNLDLGDRVTDRWRLLNGLAPVLVAAFANSRRYEGRDTGYASYRAETWRTLDWSRTGLADRGGDPAADYLDFALSANAMLRDPVDGGYSPFGALWQDGAVDLADWHTHLTTLFPEVRPRGYFEVRSLDALPPEWLAAPLAFVVGLVYDPEAARAAGEVVGRGRTALLHVAGARGLRDGRLAAQAGELVDLALAGCRRLGPDVIDEADLDIAEAFFDRYTRRRRTLSDSGPPHEAPLVAGATR